MIPQADPKAGYQAYKAGIDAAVRRVLESGAYILGPEVAAFEQEFSSYLGVKFGVGVASGTDALEIALRALDIGRGDLAFTVSHTAVATVAAIERAGATPVLVDIDPLSFTMDPGHLEATITGVLNGKIPVPGRPKAVIPVHLYGHPADMAAIQAIAQKYHLYLVEDCAQAHGAEIGGRKVGTFGHLAAFSFYPTKNLGAFGDGGLVVTDDEALKSKLIALRQYGWQTRYISARPGINSRLDELQAAILRVKLPYLEQENSRRQEIADIYTKAIKTPDLKSPARKDNVRHAYHLYVILVQPRQEFIEHLRQGAIGWGIHYPAPVHRQPAYQDSVPLGINGLPVTERISPNLLSLPLYPQMADDQVERVVAALRQWHN